MSVKKELHLTVTAADKVAVDLLSVSLGISRQKTKQAMQKGCIWLEQGQADKRTIQRLRRAKKALATGSTLHCYYDETILNIDPIPAELISDSGDYSVWNKPRFMRSQGSKWADHCTLYRWSEMHLRPERPAFIVHRLDRAASGLILLAHKKKTAAELSKLFHDRQIEKRYRVTVVGDFSTNRVEGEAVKTLSANLDSKTALSHIRFIAYNPQSNESELEVQIETGRKHQIRRHLSGFGFPVVGDRLYGDSDGTSDLKLKAVFLAFSCPLSGQWQEFRL